MYRAVFSCTFRLYICFWESAPHLPRSDPDVPLSGGLLVFFHCATEASTPSRIPLLPLSLGVQYFSLGSWEISSCFILDVYVLGYLPVFNLNLHRTHCGTWTCSLCLCPHIPSHGETAAVSSQSDFLLKMLHQAAEIPMPSQGESPRTLWALSGDWEHRKWVLV